MTNYLLQKRDIRVLFKRRIKTVVHMRIGNHIETKLSAVYFEVTIDTKNYFH